jgi:hypothetical protein
MATFSEPVWGSPQPAQQDISSLCLLDIRPSVVTGYLVRILEAHFARPENIRDAVLRDSLWTPESENVDRLTTKLQIAHSPDYNAKALGQSPALYVSRGAMAISDLSSLTGGALTLGFSKKREFDGESHVKLLSGQHMVACACQGCFPSERLAEEVLYFLMEASPFIIKDLKVAEMRVDSLAPPKKVDGGLDLWTTSVVLSWNYAYAWTMKSTSPVLKSIGIGTATGS